MMSLNIAFVMLLILAGHTTLGQTNKAQGLEGEIRQLNNWEVEALLRNDLRTLESLWSDDFVVTNPLNQLVTKREVVGLIQSGTLAFSAYDRQVEYVRAYGNMVIVAGRETVVWAGRMPAAGQASHLRFTAVWMKQSGHWQEVARHANIIHQP